MTKIGFKIKVHRSEGCHMLSTGIYRLLWLNLTSPVRLERTTCNHLQLQKHTANKKNCTTCQKDIGRVRMSEQYIQHYTVFFSLLVTICSSKAPCLTQWNHQVCCSALLLSCLSIKVLVQAPQFSWEPLSVIVAIHRVYTHLSNGKLHVVFTILG